MASIFSASPSTYVITSIVTGTMAVACGGFFASSVFSNLGLPLAYAMSYDNPYQTRQQRKEFDSFFLQRIFGVFGRGALCCLLGSISLGSGMLAVTTYTQNVLAQ